MDNKFCVVETLEDGELCYSTAPQKWVSGNILLWPAKSKLQKFRKNLEDPQNSWKNYKVNKIVASNLGMSYKY